MTLFPHDQIRELALALRADAERHNCGECLTSCWGKPARAVAAAELEKLADRLDRTFHWRRTS